MTRALPFTEASLARAINGVKKAGHYVIGIKPDGELIISDKPLDQPASILTSGPKLVDAREKFRGG